MNINLQLDFSNIFFIIKNNVQLNQSFKNLGSFEQYYLKIMFLSIKVIEIQTDFPVFQCSRTPNKPKSERNLNIFV